MKTPMMKSVALALVLVSLATGAHADADERASLESLRQTTLFLINALVDQGVLTREKADALIRDAEKKAAVNVAKAPVPAKGVIRVPYVPEAVKNEIREELKQEIMAQARTEGWATPNAVPEWLDRIQIEGDIRIRNQKDKLAGNNAPTSDYFDGAQNTGVARAPDFGHQAFTNGPLDKNTTDSRSRWRLRARLGVNARVGDDVAAGIRIATGDDNSRTSTNQTLSGNLNKYSLWLDRAFAKWSPFSWVSASGGRMPNPWFGTDLVWDDNLNFDGVAVNLSVPARWDTPVRPFLTAGYFPLRANNPPVAGDRSLDGVQLGVQWDLNANLRVRAAGALYNFRNMEGIPEPDTSMICVATTTGTGTTCQVGTANYGSTAYDSAMRQKGNTLYRLNAPSDTASNIWGLMSRFKPVVGSVALDFGYFDPIRIGLSAEYVNNTGYDSDEVARRTGLTIDSISSLGIKKYGYHYRIQVGKPALRERGDWQVVWGYRYLGSDATLDAFASSDYWLGGTNYKGYYTRAAVGLDRSTNLEVRWGSFDSISRMTFNGSQDAVTDAAIKARDRYNVDTLQVDVNVRF